MKIEDVYPLSPLQEGLFFHWKISKEAYFEQTNYKLKGKLDIDLLKESYDKLVARYSVLRTCFNDTLKEETLQIVQAEVASNFTYTDVSTRPDFSVENFKLADKQNGFDLHKGSQMRLNVLFLGDDTYELVWSHHHIIMDGWCVGILIKEFFHFYESLLQAKAPSLDKVYPYANYIKWLMKIDQKQSLNYWKEYLNGFNAITTIPKTGFHKEEYKAGEVFLSIEGERRRSIKTLCESLNITENIFIQLAWGIILSKYNNTDDIVFGAVVSGRPGEIPGVENMVGLFINTIPVRIQLGEESSVRKLLKQTQEEAISSSLHHYVQLAEIQSVSSGNMLFDNIIVFENYPVQEMVEQELDNESKEDELKLLSLDMEEESNFDFSLAVIPGEELRVRFTFNENSYDQTQIERLKGHFNQVVIQMLENPDVIPGDIDYLSSEEKQELLFGFNRTELSSDPEQNLAALFEQQAQNTPDNIALVFNGKQLTFRELNIKANQFGRYLTDKHDINSGSFVGVHLERSDWMVVAMLGILKSGGVYIPIDINYPQERIDFIAEDSNCKVVVDKKLIQGFEKEDDLSEAPFNNVNAPTDLAYVIYTSGSTGKPKGVMIEHRNIVSFLENCKEEFNLKEEIRSPLLASNAFDIFMFELFYPLLSGGTVFMLEQEHIKDVFHLTEHLKNVNAFHAVPALMAQVVDYISETKSTKEYQGIKNLFIGGDVVPKNVLENMHDVFPTADIHVLYGPTESTVFVTTAHYLKKNKAFKDTGIGTPNLNAPIYILNEHEKLCPINVIGEICVSGPQVARGYLNQSETTAEKFVTNPFNTDEVIYKTGDLARWLPDGSIEFQGRKDNQVKIRGHRVELGEIEYALQQQEAIDSAVVLAKESVAGEKKLAAYIVSNETLNAAELRTFLNKSMPAYMLPDYYVQMDKLPLTSNGKVDRRHLPDPKGLEMGTGIEYLAPRNDIEKELVSIWQEILAIEKVGVKDNFFELGGHSLKITRLAGQILKKIGVKLTVKDLFANSVLEDQAQLVRKTVTKSFTNIPVAKEQLHYPLSSSQRRLWVLSQFQQGNLSYNMSGIQVIDSAINLPHFIQSFKDLILRHEILRTVFKEDEKEDVRQYIIPMEDFDFAMVQEDLRDEKEPQHKLNATISKEFNTAFDLRKGPLLRSRLIRLKDDQYVFCYVLHHIICDGWSIDLMIKELMQGYDAYSNEKVLSTEPLRIQYKDYTVWQQKQLGEENLESHRAYWMEQFSGSLPVLTHFGDHPRPPVKTFNGATVRTNIDAKLSNDFKQLCRSQEGTLFMGLLGAVNTLLHKYTGQDDFIIGSPVAGREHVDLENQIGFYINTLALRTRLQKKDNFQQLYKKIKETTLNAYEHQMYPFDELVEMLSLDRDVSRSALFDVMIVLQNIAPADSNSNQSNSIIESSGFEPPANKNSKYDLTFKFSESDEGIQVGLEYNSDIYTQNMAKRLLLHLEQLLSAVVSNPLTPINEISCLNSEELLERLNTNQVAYPVEKNIVEIFEAQALDRPDNIALVYEQETLTYKELNEKANQLAHCLLEKGVQPEELIPVCIDRSFEMMIGILGVLKAGGVYVPIDPDYPEERISFILEDTSAQRMVSTSTLENRFKSYANISTVYLSADSNSKYPESNPGLKIKSDSLAYIIYTSGTTGQPKGVLLEHRNVVRLFFNEAPLFNFSSEDVWSLFHSFCFDFSVWEMYGALLHGGKLVIVPKLQTRDFVLFSKLLKEQEVTVLNMTPSAFKVLQEQVIQNDTELKVQNVVFGGEMLIPASLKGWKEKFPDCKLINMYGITETTVHVTYKEISETEIKLNTSNIGRAIPTLACHVLNEDFQLVPIGAPGELYVSGEGVARGYLNRTELTQERFLEHEFIDGEKRRLYRSGDLVRRSSNGDLEYMGRIDSQVKVRGYRIELGEIIARLEEIDFISQALVLAKPTVSGDKELVAYVVSEKSLNVSNVLSALRKMLPEYMIPHHFVKIDEFPLTSNGKIDQGKLPDPEDFGAENKTEYVKPRSDIEQKLVAIWEAILDKERIGIKDNFFELGGHSLKATRLITHIKKEFDVKIDLLSLFHNPTIENVASEIDKTLWATNKVLEASDTENFVI